MRLIFAIAVLAAVIAAVLFHGSDAQELMQSHHTERISGTGGDVLEDDPVGKLKVYVYDLPAKYNTEPVEKDPRCLTHMFATEIFVHRSLLTSAVRTLDPDEADWFYTPVYTTCDLTPSGHPMPFDSPRMMRSAIRLIADRWPYWNRSEGADHFFVAPHDFGACFHFQEEKAMARGILPLLRRATLVQTFGQRNHVCLKDGSITVPPYAPPWKMESQLLPPATPRLTGANPFDLFQHFTSAPASPRRAAAIYAHFAEGNGSDGGRDGAGDGGDDGDSDGDEEFQPRRSYATGGSSVPFDWEERPGTPKRGFGGGVAANEAAWDTEFEFGTQVGKAAPAETLTTADELFEKGKIRPLKPNPKVADEPKIRPLKPPPGLLDGGSVASSPRSPMARGAGAMWSPRRRSRVGSGVDFDPFAAALLEATKAPSPLGGKDDKGGFATGSPPKKSATRTASRSSRSAGWRRWRLSDLLLFRSSSDGGRVNKQEVPDMKPVQQLIVPVKKQASAQPAVTIKAGSAKGDNVGNDWKQHGNRNAAAAAESVAGCARLSPLQRLAKGLGAYSWHQRGMAAPANKG